MNKEAYKSDTRYEKVFHNMELLGIVDITTNRQHRNGTQYGDYRSRTTTDLQV